MRRPAVSGGSQHDERAAVLLSADNLNQHEQEQHGSLRVRRASVQSTDERDEYRLPWVERFAISIGASRAPRPWRIAINAVVVAVVAFEFVWWVAVAWREREQATVCVVGATLDALRGMFATVACGGYALLVARGWLNTILQDPTVERALNSCTQRWVLGAVLYVGLDTGWMLYRNIELGFTVFAANTEAGATRVAIGSSNFASGAVLLSTQWAFIVSLACVCTQASHSIDTCNISKLSAKELVETFRDIKSKHDKLFRVAHGSTFLTILVFYCFLNWCWVFAIHLASALDVEIGGVSLVEECVFMRSFGWGSTIDSTGDVKSALIVAESLIRRLMLLIILLLVIGRFNGCPKALIDRLPMEWYARNTAAADLWLVERCMTVDSLSIYIVGWPVTTSQAATVIGALVVWAAGEVLARLLFD